MATLIIFLFLLPILLIGYAIFARIYDSKSKKLKIRIGIVYLLLLILFSVFIGAPFLLGP